MAIESICVVGLGYIGLPTAAMFASTGLSVIGLEISEEVIETVNNGACHFEENGLREIVADAVSKGNLRATSIVPEADAYVIAVPTPLDANLEPDIKMVEVASRKIASKLRRGSLVILESTSPVGTTEKICDWIAEERPDLTMPNDSRDPDIHVSYCPERVLPGNIISEIVENDRIIGGITELCSDKSAALYHRFVTGDCRTTNSRVAEMAKLVENSFRDVNIAFANELSMICRKLEINVWELIALANRHPRVNILQPGPGVGGHCIAVDPWFIVSQHPEEAKLIRAARDVNELKPKWVLREIEDAVATQARLLEVPAETITIGCMGLAFKPNVDDFRQSPALQIVRNLVSRYPDQVLVTDPFITKELEDELPVVDLEKMINDSQIVVRLVAHSMYETPLALNENQIEISFVSGRSN